MIRRVPDLRLWLRCLRDLAQPSLAGTPLDADGPTRVDADRFISEFADDSGHRRAVDRPILGRLLGIDPGPRPEAAAPDVSLWWAVHDAAVDPWSTIAPGSGPLIGPRRDTGLEIWTETELACLHALWWVAHRRGSLRMLERCLDAARCHLVDLQPDNATNHPWAVHVFLDLALRARASTDADADDYAQGLVSGCQIALGRPDRFSACLLLDAADAVSRLLRDR